MCIRDSIYCVQDVEVGVGTFGLELGEPGPNHKSDHRVDRWLTDKECFIPWVPHMCVQLLHFAQFIFIVYLLWTVRRRLRMLYSMRESEIETGLISVCGAPCSLCQMMQHVYAYSKTGGSPCNLTATGDPEDVDLNVVHAPMSAVIPVGVPSAPPPEAPPGYEEKSLDKH
eukprot:TRINITY_DN2809_c0_g1_i1.p1 TRINITY_DN2809_c0_g1~~TRINITY_DN2809_c0_g1_i1.p1  ORF type:complete len:170 (-),score=34.30 TRINITY_DN2809_c0_g1_i1:172-681(-)